MRKLMQEMEDTSKNSSSSTLVKPVRLKKDGTPRKPTGPKPEPRPVAKPTTEYSLSANQERILEVCDMMRDFTFKRGKTVRELAKKWGVSWDYAAHLTGQASRIVREELTNADHVGATIGEALLRIVDEGMEGPLKNRKMVIFAAKLLTEISPGLRAPTEQTVSVRKADGLPDDPDELRKLAHRLMEREAEEGVREYTGEIVIK